MSTESRQFDTPILFIIFNRPEETRRVFDEIRKVRPSRLFVAADGPRADKPDDAENCGSSREIATDVDWQCEVKTLFRGKNLGCGVAEYQAMTWFFENVSEGIIVEDDCLPHPSFFPYCRELLEYYRDDPRIMTISGDNFQLGERSFEGSYYFSKYPSTWGWASWKRAWDMYDFNVPSLPDFLVSSKIKNVCRSAREQEYWTNVFRKVLAGQMDTWDYQWTYAMWKNGGIAISPSRNLISNIGYSTTATHTNQTRSPLSNIPTVEMPFPMIHPASISIDEKADRNTFEHFYLKEFTPYDRIRSLFMRNAPQWSTRLASKIKKCL